METKYYTPIIEEFHYGFDFETKENDKWIKLSFWEGICLKSADREWLNEFISNGEIRVKCLDNQDIIDLGWTYRGEGGFNRYEKERYTMQHYTEDDTVVISDPMFIIVRRIKIKNKSELKRIMQMLKIIE
jgi:hypothetical protein